MKRFVFAVSAVLVLASSSFAQDPAYAEDLQFVRELRNHGYNDLAREYLAKLAKNAPPALQKELPLERALTEMEAANEEPDSSKRIAMYAEARQQFQRFLQANPNHPRATDAKFEIAHATTLKGKAELNRARLESDPSMRSAEGKKARATFADALAQLEKLKPSKPEIEMAKALNLLDQSESYLNTGSDAETRESTNLITKASKILDSLAQGENTSKITWQARAWSGRCLEMQDTPGPALDKYRAILEATGPAARDGKRLAYFFMVLAQKHDKQTPIPTLIKELRSWLTAYPSYTRTPEGYGVQYWLAKLLLEEAGTAKMDAQTKKGIIAEARKYLGKVEQTENEYTDLAKSLKLEVMAAQGTFKADISKLKTFEDCFARAQFEQREIATDAKQFPDNKARIEEARKKRMAAAIEALKLGLTKPDAQKPSPERSTAQAMLTFFLMDEGKYREAIEIGEKFANNEPKAGPASTAAIYALVSYGELLAERESKAEGKSLKDDKEYQNDAARMLALARTMEERWPKERAGDLARDTIARRLLREDKIPEAIQKLAAITPSYPSYVQTQFLLARAALQQAASDKEHGYQEIGMKALRDLPEPDAAASNAVREDYVQAKLLLGLELYKAKKLKEVDAALAALAPKLATWKLDDDKTRNEDKRKKFEEGRQQLSLYSTALQADIDFKAGKFAEVAKRLDPLIDAFNADKLAALKEAGPLGASIVALDLRANVQTNDLKHARDAVKALRTLQTDKEAEKGADNTTAILASLVSLISQQVEEVRKKGDKEALKKVQAGFTAILDDVAGGKKKKTPELAFYLARCYAGMDEHAKAVEQLKPFSSAEAVPDVRWQHGIQLLLIQEYLQLKDTDNAQKLLTTILGEDNKGWGAKSLEAQKLRVQLMEGRDQYAAAAMLSAKYVSQLVKRLDDNKLRESYFEFYYHLVYCLLKHGQRQDDATKKAKYVKEAADKLVAMEKQQNGFGSEESKKRFEALLAKESDLRNEYNAHKRGK